MKNNTDTDEIEQLFIRHIDRVSENVQSFETFFHRPPTDDEFTQIVNMVLGVWSHIEDSHARGEISLPYSPHDQYQI
jgi:hypothetical protein